MKISTSLLACTLFMSLSSAHAVEGLTANIGATNDYMWRGMTQNNHDIALSGGIDYAAESGFYAGTWVSNVDFGSADETNYEMDFYAGYGGEINNFSYDVGYILYAFPDANDINMGELYASINWQDLSLKISTLATSDVNNADFGDDTYIEGAYSFDLGNDLTLSLHAGSYSRENAENFVDYSVSISKGAFTFSVMDVSKDIIDEDVRVVLSYSHSIDL
ncbi:MAG: hypothetical protein ACI9LM_003476 [Alteromonadaceae bacterium]|jgi:uncharacterized protein (TIGR02001 family)